MWPRRQSVYLNWSANSTPLTPYTLVLDWNMKKQHCRLLLLFRLFTVQLSFISLPEVVFYWVIYYFTYIHNLCCSLHGAVSELPQGLLIGVYTALTFHLGAANGCFTTRQLEMYKSYAKFLKPFQNSEQGNILSFYLDKKLGS
jgi:hypothetical protein